MNVILFGATGMVGQGVLRECLLDPDVERILSIVRAPTGRSEPKLRELVHKDFFDFSAIENELASYDACFFCLGVSSAGMNEADYTRVTYDVKGKTENDLLRLPFKAAYMFRPAAIVPLYRVKSKTKLYQFFYTTLGPLLPMMYKVFPQYVTTTEQIGRAMLKVAKHGAPKPVLENSDINKI